MKEGASLRAATKSRRPSPSGSPLAIRPADFHPDSRTRLGYTERVNLRREAMNLTIDLSDHNAAELEAQARAACMPADRYLAEIVAHALESQHRNKVRRLEEHLD